MAQIDPSQCTYAINIDALSKTMRELSDTKKISVVQSEILKVEYPSEAKREDQRRIEDNIFENIYQV
jgi:hypothetical protein